MQLHWQYHWNASIEELESTNAVRCIHCILSVTLHEHKTSIRRLDFDISSKIDLHQGDKKLRSTFSMRSFRSIEIMSTRRFRFHGACDIKQKRICLLMQRMAKIDTVKPFCSRPRSRKLKVSMKQEEDQRFPKNVLGILSVFLWLLSMSNHRGVFVNPTSASL